MKKPILTQFILLIFFLALTACGTDEPPPEPVTLKFVIQSYEADYYQPLADEFMLEHPEITLEITTVRGNNFEAYAEADVVGVNFFTFLYFQNEGVYLDLTPLIEQDKSFDHADFYPGTMDLFSRADKVWAIPSGIDTYVMYYNKTLFDQSELSYPAHGWSWDDMFNASAIIRQAGGENQFGYVVPDGYVDLNGMILMSQNNGQLFDDLNNPTEVTFNHPNNVEAMQWYQDLYYEFNVAPTPEQSNTAFGYGNESNIRGILQGDIALWPGNFSDRNGATWGVSWQNLSWGMVTLPRKANGVTSGIGTAYAIAADTLHPETSWLWLVYLSEQIPQNLIPARRSLAESSAFSDRVGAEIAETALQSMEEVTLISPDLLDFQGALQNFNTAIMAIHNGEASAQEALDHAQQLSQP